MRTRAAVLLFLLSRAAIAVSGSTGVVDTYKPIRYFDSESDSGDYIQIVALPHVGNTHCGDCLECITEPEVRGRYDINATEGTSITLTSDGCGQLLPGHTLIMEIGTSVTPEATCSEDVMDSVLHCVRKVVRPTMEQEEGVTTVPTWRLLIHSIPENSRWKAYEGEYPFLDNDHPAFVPTETFSSAAEFRLRLLALQPQISEGYLASLFTNPADGKFTKPAMINKVEVIAEKVGSNWATYVFATGRSNGMRCSAGVLFKLRTWSEKLHLVNVWQFQSVNTTMSCRRVEKAKTAGLEVTYSSAATHKEEHEFIEFEQN